MSSANTPEEKACSRCGVSMTRQDELFVGVNEDTPTGHHSAHTCLVNLQSKCAELERERYEAQSKRSAMESATTRFLLKKYSGDALAEAYQACLCEKPSPEPVAQSPEKRFEIVGLTKAEATRMLEAIGGSVLWDREQCYLTETVIARHMRSAEPDSRIAAIPNAGPLATDLLERVQAATELDKKSVLLPVVRARRIIEALSAAENLLKPVAETETSRPFFEYRGIAYNRPMGRGICIGKELDALDEKLPDEWFDIEIRATQRKSETGDGNAK